MLYDVEQVASKLNVSKQAIYNKLKLKEYKNKIIIKQGKTMLDDDLIKLIQDNLKFKSNMNTDDNSDPKIEPKEADTTMLNDDFINMNQELIKTLLDQLKIKDMQIQEKDTQIKALNDRLQQEQKLHENAQVLLRQEQQKPQLLLEEHFKQVDDRLMELRAQLEKRKEDETKGVFQRLFNR